LGINEQRHRSLDLNTEVKKPIEIIKGTGSQHRTKFFLTKINSSGEILETQQNHFVTLSNIVPE
jgi:hypothetical protein